MFDYSNTPSMTVYRRRLPHFHPDGECLFVTWRLHGSLPVPEPDVIYPTPGHLFVAQDRALARASGTLWLSDTRVARQVAETIRAGESRKFYELSAWVVMPNHVHLLILPSKPLPQITHWTKGRTAREANLVLGRFLPAEPPLRLRLKPRQRPSRYRRYRDAQPERILQRRGDAMA